MKEGSSSHPDPEEVIDPSSSEFFCCLEHLMKYMHSEMPDWDEAWWTIKHVSVH